MVNVNVHMEVKKTTEVKIRRVNKEEQNEESYDVLSIAPEVDIFLHPMQTEALMKMLEDFKANDYMQTITQCDIPVQDYNCSEF
jgi:DNA replication protein DnaD